MKRFSTLFLAFVAVFSLQAQVGTQGDGFVFRVTSPALGVNDYTDQTNTENCGWGYAQFGADVTEELDGEIVWAYDNVGNDSLCCDTIVQDLTGKIALIRRGTCEFGRKSLWAELAGAKAVIIANHYATATQTACTTIGMGAGAVGAQVTIPCIFLPRLIVEQIDADMKAGNTPHGYFLLPRMQNATAAYHWATPVSQVDTMDHLTVHYINRLTVPQDNVVLKADITEPSGAVKTLTVDLGTVAPGLDTLVYFPPYLPAAEIGEFNVVMTNNKYNEGRDSLRRSFVNTQYTWSQATFTNDAGGIGPTNTQFQDNGYRYQVGGLCLTGDTPGAKATYVSFGISNIDSVYVPGGLDENKIAVLLYDGDVDDDGQIDFEATWDDMGGQIVGFGEYTMTGTEQDGEILSAALTDGVTGDPFVNLEANHPYYVSILYDGLLAGYGRCVRFMNSLDEHYLNFPTTPVYIDQMYSGWVGAVVMHRLQLEGFDPTVSTKSPSLDASKFSITPNPANDLVNVNLDLEATNKSVAVRMIDWTGRSIDAQMRKNFQNGQISFDTKSLPSGMYMFWISTEEGMTIQKVAVCH